MKIYLSPSEEKLFDFLKRAEKFLDNSDLWTTNNAAFGNEVRNTLRNFSLRIFKRSYGVKNSMFRHCDELVSFKRIIDDQAELKALEKSFSRLINTETRSFEASLITTFGQPEPPKDKNALIIGDKISIKTFSPVSCKEKPDLGIRYMQMHNRIIPINFELFSALTNVQKD